MEIILKNRQSGKTTDLIRKCALDGGYIVCNSIKEAHRIFEQSKKMKVNIPLPITYNEFLNGHYYAQGIETVYIDNADLFLQSISKVKIGAITLSKEEHK